MTGKSHKFASLAAKDLLRDSAWTFIAKFLASALSVALDAYLSRNLQPEEMGGWFLASKTVVVFALLGGLGIPVSLVRYGNTLDAEGRRRFALPNLFFLAHVMIFLGSGLGAAVYYWVLGPLTPQIFDSPILLSCLGSVSVWIVFRGLQPLTAQSFRAIEKYHLASVFGPAMPLFIALPMISLMSLIKVSITLNSVIYCIAGSIAVSVVISACLIFRHAKALTGAGAEHLKAALLLTGSLPLLVSQFFQDFLSKVDVWIVGSASSVEAVAIYGAASKVILITSFFIIIRDTVLSSRIAKRYSLNDIAGIDGFIRQSAKLTTMPALLILVILYVVAGPVLNLIFGPAYEAARYSLRYLIAGQIVVMLGGPAAITLAMSGNQRAAMILSLVTSGLGLIAAFILGGRFGPEGVAMSIMCAAWAQAAGSVYLVFSRTGIWTPIFPAFRLRRADR